MAKKSLIKLDDRRKAALLYTALTDESQPVKARLKLLNWLDQLFNRTGLDLQHPAFFGLAFKLASREIMATQKPTNLGVADMDDWCAHQAYERIEEYLDRLARGESLSDIYEAEEAARTAKVLPKSGKTSHGRGPRGNAIGRIRGLRR